MSNGDQSPVHHPDALGKRAGHSAMDSQAAAFKAADGSEPPRNQMREAAPAAKEPA